MMESQFTLVFIVSFLSLVHGYTPTFRNEATHPLKAPTESTLQMNEESSGRTNSNIQKHDTYFSGGKHFEYMLLNGSNVLLTSLQNDSPYDNPAEQVVSPKPELFTRPDFTKNNSLVENVSRNKTYLVTKPLNASSSWNKTTPVRNNFTAITKLKSNHNSTWFSVNTMPEQSVTKFSVRRPDFRKFEKPNISSPTRLYSRSENKSNENFASFTSPIVAKPVVSIYSDGSIPETEEKPAQKQSYDYDDSFTKLLISNGILKPDNKEGWRSVADSSSSSVPPSTEKMYSKAPPKKFNASGVTNTPNDTFSSTYTHILKDRITSVDPGTVMSSQNVTKAPESIWNSNNVTHLPIASHDQDQEQSTKDVAAVDSMPAGIPNLQELSTKSSAGITSNSVGDLNVDESPREASAESNTLSIITNKPRTNVEKQNKIQETYQPLKKYTLPIVKKNFFPDTMIFNDLVQNENSAKPFNAKNLTRDQPVKISVKSYSNKVEDLSNESYPPMTKFYQIPSSKVIDDKNRMADSKNKTAKEFQNLVEKSLQQLFLPVAKFFSNYKENLPGNTHLDDKVKNFKINIEDSRDVKVTLKSFTFTNLVEVLQNKSKNRKSNEPQLLRVDRDLTDNEPQETIFNWTDLNNGKNVNLEDTINELFSEDDDVHWFVLLLAGNSTIAEMRKEDFVKYLKVNLAARLSLEYNDIRINAILVVPPNLMVNVSLPANESPVNVNEEVNVEEHQKIGSIHELAETNATLLELSGQEYHVVQLLCLKSQQSVQNSLPQTARVIDRKHDDIEFYIFLIVGAICMFGMISPLLYTLYKLIQKRLTTYTFKIPDVFREKIKPPPHEKINESTCESLNVIFSEDFDRKYSSTSWFDNTQHSSSILKPSSEVPPAFFVPKDESFTDFCDITRNPIENSPRLSKENKLNMLGCRPSCVLLPHQGRYQIDTEYDPDKYFDNPNYSHDAR
ncbi:uncharacterized protein LOC135835547 [Planococcus citri]|uniref:uncharacterized protein LOC135835547 n=1 Tax=Planococcus citri TaxID=170843 RepID=UPI0031F8FEC1